MFSTLKYKTRVEDVITKLQNEQSTSETSSIRRIAISLPRSTIGESEFNNKCPVQKIDCYVKKSRWATLLKKIKENISSDRLTYVNRGYREFWLTPIEHWKKTRNMSQCDDLQITDDHAFWSYEFVYISICRNDLNACRNRIKTKF